MPKIAMEITANGNKATLYEFSTFEKYYFPFYSELTLLEKEEIYQYRLQQHLKWQGRLVKEFIKGNKHNGKH